MDDDLVDADRERARAAALEASRAEFLRLVEEERARGPRKRIPLGVPLETDDRDDPSAGA
ncbi:MAG: hypothetical protein AAFZ07_04560 [Actinomycetota bacterium]